MPVHLPNEIYLEIASALHGDLSSLSALSRTSWNMHSLLSTFLYTRGAQDPNSLCAAAELSLATSVRRLCASGASVMWINDDEELPLVCAARAGRTALFKILRGGLVEETEGAPAEPFPVGSARAAAYKETMQVLLFENLREQGDFYDDEGFTPLFYAAGCGETRMCEILLALGVGNAYRYTTPPTVMGSIIPLSPLHAAIRYGHTDTLRVLLTDKYVCQCLQENLNDWYSYDPRPGVLQYAVESENVDAVRILLEAGAEIEVELDYVNATVRDYVMGGPDCEIKDLFEEAEAARFAEEQAEQEEEEAEQEEEEAEQAAVDQAALQLAGP